MTRGQTYAQWRAEAENATYPNSTAEKAFLKAGEKKMREKTRPVVASFNNLLADTNELILDSLDTAEEASKTARKAIRAAERRQVDTKELRKTRDTVHRAELDIERELAEYDHGIERALNARDNPENYLDNVVTKFKSHDFAGLDLDLPPLQ